MVFITIAAVITAVVVCMREQSSYSTFVW